MAYISEMVHEFFTCRHFETVYLGKLSNIPKLVEIIKSDDTAHFSPFKNMDIVFSGNMILNSFLLDDEILKIMKQTYGKSFDFTAHAFSDA